MSESCQQYGTPELSVAIPFYNEEVNAESTVRNLILTLEAHGVDFELTLVNNGSQDRTGRILEELVASDARLLVLHVPQNKGYGWGVLSGLGRCRGRYVGYTWADEQVRSIDLVRIFTQLKAEGADLAKACRKVRHDGLVRRVVTTIYNRCFPLFFPVQSRDINGCPKLFRREVLMAMGLECKDWFLDAEIMIKANRQGLRIAEVPVVLYPRRGGRSNVSFLTILEFVRNALWYRIHGGP